MRELHLDIPYSNNGMPIHFISCDGLLFCASWSWESGAMVWNPWLRQTRWIEPEEERFTFDGIGYDSGRPEKGYKIFGSGYCQRKLNDNIFEIYNRFSIYNFETNARKYIDILYGEETSMKEHSLHNNVSLNGNLYWITYNHDTVKYLIQNFDFSQEIFETFCVLPWKNDPSSNTPVLSVFGGNRLSLLRKFDRTNQIEI